MTLEASVLGDDAVRRTADGYEVDVHLAWYRSLPLSCVEDVAVTVAGHTPDRNELRVLKDGRSLSLDDLAALVDDEWFVQDPLTVAFVDESRAAVGDEVEVGVKVAARIPYILIGPDKALVMHTQVARKVVVQ